MTPDEIRGAHWRGQALRDEQRPAALSSASATEAALRGERDEAREALAEILSLTDQHEAPGPRIPAALWLRSRSVLARIRKEPDHE